MTKVSFIYTIGIDVEIPMYKNDFQNISESIKIRFITRLKGIVHLKYFKIYENL